MEARPVSIAALPENVWTFMLVTAYAEKAFLTLLIYTINQRMLQSTYRGVASSYQWSHSRYIKPVSQNLPPGLSWSPCKKAS